MFSRSMQGPDSQTSFLERWKIQPKTRNVTRSTLDSTSQEFPRYNESYTGKPYRYAYTISASLENGDGPKESRNCIIKHDLENNSRLVRELQSYQYPGEFVFVPTKDGKHEDDGWLMGFVIDSKSETTDFVIFAGQALLQEPVASVRIPHIIPYGFHGNWCPN